MRFGHLKMVKCIITLKIVFNADCYTWSDDMMDKDLLKANNFFKTQQEAEKYAEHFKQILKNREL